MTTPRRVATIYDAIAPTYEERYHDARALAENAVLADLLDKTRQRALSNGGPVLDIGCGTGLTLDLAAIPPSDYLGIDMSTGMLDIARQRHPAHTFLWSLVETAPEYNARAAIALFSLCYQPVYLGLRAAWRQMQPLAPLLAVFYTRRRLAHRERPVGGDAFAVGVSKESLFTAAYHAGFARIEVSGLTWSRNPRLVKWERRLPLDVDKADYLVLQATKGV